MAARQADNDAIRLLLKHEADVNAVVRASGRNALHLCVEKANLEGLQLILAKPRVEVSLVAFINP